MALFGPGLFAVHRAWGDPFFLVVERLLGIINLNRSSSAEGASLAFNFLPGLFGAYFLSRKMPIADFLNGLLRGPAFSDDRDFPNSILVVARAHATTLIALRGRTGSGSKRPVPAATKLIRRTERLVWERRPCSPPNSSRIFLTVI